MLFWDDFSDDGELGAEPDPHNTVGVAVACSARSPRRVGRVSRSCWPGVFRIARPSGAAGRLRRARTRRSSAITTAPASRPRWRRPNTRRPTCSGSRSQTRLFAGALRESTIPAVVKEAASANLSTLVSTTCFRTADGEFHGFEGVDDHRGCCFGNCTHVWNYESATPHLFPSLARSLRAAAFGYSMDDAGAMHFRQLLPDGSGTLRLRRRRWADGADRPRLSGLVALRRYRLAAPHVASASRRAWSSPGSPAAGMRTTTASSKACSTTPTTSSSTGPIRCAASIIWPRCARAKRWRAPWATIASAAEYRRLFESGRQWIDANLFNGEFYVQKIRGFAKDKIAPALRSDMGSEDTEKPAVPGRRRLPGGSTRGPVHGRGRRTGAAGVPRTTSRRRSASIYRYNHKRSLANHDTVQRTFALNDEAAMVICDYGKAERPRIPFPYYAEVMTGFEYSTAAHMIYAGMVAKGSSASRNIRARYDGEKRNPWDEAECGHHYARAMAAWSGVLAFSGFRYHGPKAALSDRAACPPRTIHVLLVHRDRLGHVLVVRRTRN